MKNKFRYYAAIWTIFLAVFQAVVFLVRPVIPGYAVHYDMRFWIAWGFIVAAFAGNLFCTKAAFRAENSDKLFYRLPLIKVSYAGLTVMLVVGSVLMLIPNCPPWSAAVVCLTVAALTAVAVLKAMWAGDTASAVQEKTERQTQQMRLLTVKAENLLNKAKSPEASAAAKKVYEALRYSDPMSNAALSEIEEQVVQAFSAFSAAVNDGKDGTAEAETLLACLTERNGMCKAAK